MNISYTKILKPQILTFLKLFFTDPKYECFCKISDPKYLHGPPYTDVGSTPPGHIRLMVTRLIIINRYYDDDDDDNDDGDDNDDDNDNDDGDDDDHGHDDDSDGDGDDGDDQAWKKCKVSRESVFRTKNFPRLAAAIMTS